MAYVTGTATNYRDLLGKLRDFLVSNATLVGLGQNWTLLSGPASGTPTVGQEIVLKGPGLAGDDDIRLGFKLYENAGLGHYSLGIVGLTSSGVNDIENQPGASIPHWMLLLNTSMNYWFIGSGRAFRVIVRCGSNYPQMYGGFILPLHLPDNWPYPLFVGACTYDRAMANSNNTGYNSAFWKPTAESTSLNARSCASLCDPGRMWRGVANLDGSNSGGACEAVNSVPWFQSIFDQNFRGCVTNQPTVVQGGLFCRYASIGRNNYGLLEGVYYLPAFGMTPESITTIAGVDYLHMPNVFRTTDGNMAAYSLA